MFNIAVYVAKTDSAAGVYAVSFFFFQAEDGIRDLTVTGVQTCALPIWAAGRPVPRRRSCAASAAATARAGSGRPPGARPRPGWRVRPRPPGLRQGPPDRKSVV